MMRMWYDDQSVDNFFSNHVFFSNQLRVLMGELSGVKGCQRGVKGVVMGS